MLLAATRFLSILADTDPEVGRRFQDYLREQVAAEASEDQFVIQAEAHSDDRVFEVQFDAGEWFKQATDDEIGRLARCGWGGDYPADSVAHFMADHSPPLAKLFEYLEHIAGLPSKKNVCGFECHVDEDAAMSWLRQFKPELAKKIEPADEQLDGPVA
jgi:hypothetical protein